MGIHSHASAGMLHGREKARAEGERTCVVTLVQFTEEDMHIPWHRTVGSFERPAAPLCEF